MAFVVETGAGLSNSNSYVSVAEADTLLEQDVNRPEWKCLSTQEREVALRFATRWLDVKFRWYGNVFNPTGPQALQWPRTKVIDQFGTILAGGTMPNQLKLATARVALELAKASSLASGAEDLTATVESSGAIKSFQIETLSISFDTGTEEGSFFRQFVGKRFSEIELLLHSIGELREATDLMEAL